MISTLECRLPLCPWHQQSPTSTTVEQVLHVSRSTSWYSMSATTSNHSRMALRECVNFHQFLMVFHECWQLPRVQILMVLHEWKSLPPQRRWHVSTYSWYAMSEKRSTGSRTDTTLSIQHACRADQICAGLKRAERETWDTSRCGQRSDRREQCARRGRCAQGWRVQSQNRASYQ